MLLRESAEFTSCLYSIVRLLWSEIYGWNKIKELRWVRLGGRKMLLLKVGKWKRYLSRQSFILPLTHPSLLALNNDRYFTQDFSSYWIKVCFLNVWPLSSDRILRTFEWQIHQRPWHFVLNGLKPPVAPQVIFVRDSPTVVYFRLHGIILYISFYRGSSFAKSFTRFIAFK